MRHLNPEKITDRSPGDFSLVEHRPPGRTHYLQIVNIVSFVSKTLMMSILFRNITRPQHQPDDVEKIHFLSLGVWPSGLLGLAANTYALAREDPEFI